MLKFPQDLTCVFTVAFCCLLQLLCVEAQSSTVRPYQFGFTIDEQQHRFEKRDERGIVMGEFGFITADGIYHVTVYATDEEGRFRILAMKSYPYSDRPKTYDIMMTPKKSPTTTTTTTTIAPKSDLPRHNFYNEACSGCFLSNGDDKPKNPGGNTQKTGIRTLSKDLPATTSKAGNSPGSSTQPKVGGATGASKPKAAVGKPQTGFQTPNTQTGKLSYKQVPFSRVAPQFQTTTPSSVATSPAAIVTTPTITLHLTAPPVVGGEPQQPATFKPIIAPRYTQTPTAAPKQIKKQQSATHVFRPVVATRHTQTPTTAVNAITQTPAHNVNRQDKPPQPLTPAKKPTLKPQVMDVIVKKVLPAVIGMPGVVAKPGIAQTPSARNPSNSLIPSGKSGGSSSSIGKANANPQSKAPIGGDGDLYRFKYILDYHGHTETGKHNGNKEGNYFAVGDDDIERTIDYVANENGFQPRIHWRKLNNKIAATENSLKDYEFVWFTQN